MLWLDGDYLRDYQKTNQQSSQIDDFFHDQTPLGSFPLNGLDKVFLLITNCEDIKEADLSEQIQPLYPR